MADAEDGDLIAAIKTDAILAPYADALLRLARPSIRLTVDPDAPRSMGESGVGGPPAAMSGSAGRTPRRHAAPEPGVARLAHLRGTSLAGRWRLAIPVRRTDRLAAVAPFDVDGLLPRTGVLLFFYDEFYSSRIDPAGPFKPTSWSLREGEPEFYEREFGYDQVDQVRVLHSRAT